MASGEATSEELDERRHRIRAAGLSVRAASLKPSQFSTSSKAKTFFEYLGSAAYPEDLSNGVGVCLSGDPALRSDLFSLHAKGFAVAARPVFYCTIHALIYFLEADADRRGMIARCEHVFIDGFEKEFRDESVPYTTYQRMEVEDFLKTRFDAGLVTNFSACRRWESLRWWSADFVNTVAPQVRNVVL